VLVTVGIVATLLGEGLPFFKEVGLGDFLTGTTWQPNAGEFGVMVTVEPR
jgi:ABC-type phosphate transport system permease subunit